MIQFYIIFQFTIILSLQFINNIFNKNNASTYIQCKQSSHSVEVICIFRQGYNLR